MERVSDGNPDYTVPSGNVGACQGIEKDKEFAHFNFTTYTWNGDADITDEAPPSTVHNNRLTPFLQPRKKSLLGRPRASSMSKLVMDSDYAKSELCHLTTAVRGHNLSGSSGSTDNSPTSYDPSPHGSETSVLPRPRRSVSAASTKRISLFARETDNNSVAAALTPALSNLTATANPGCSIPSAEISPVAQPCEAIENEADSEGLDVNNDNKDGNIARQRANNSNNILVPLLSPDGQLLGYKQNSLVLRKLMQVSIPNSAFFNSDNENNQDSPSYWNNNTGANSPSFAARVPSTDEFFAASQDACCGFPDPENQVPGYLLGPIIGKGGFSSVHKAIHVATGLPVAVKVIDKSRLKDPKDRDRVDREIRVMRQLGSHVAIAQLYECAETPKYIYIIMEYCQGGSLLDLVRNRRKLPEDEACTLFQQLLAALQHCHARGVVHRDIKLENILLDGQGGLRLVDFGLCGYYMPGKPLRCHCGSPSYAAPEIVGRQQYLAPPVDVWSAGVVLFAMLAGWLPFHAKDKKALSAKILKGNWTAPDWVSEDALDLLCRMLTVDSCERIHMADIWDHPWVTSNVQWEGHGQGPGGLLRYCIDPKSGAPIPDPEVVTAWAVLAGNIAVGTLLRALHFKECNALTAGYYLLCHAKANTNTNGKNADIMNFQIREQEKTYYNDDNDSDNDNGTDDDSHGGSEIFVV